MTRSNFVVCDPISTTRSAGYVSLRVQIARLDMAGLERSSVDGDDA